MGAYTVPPHVSPECKELIDMMLVVDPMARTSISQIREHPWYQENLPAYLRFTPMRTTLTADTIDEAVLQELMLKFRLSRPQAVSALLDGEGDIPDSHQLVVAYDLIYDAKRQYSERDDGSTASRAKDVVTWCTKTEEAKLHAYERTVERGHYNNMWCLGISSTESPHKIMTTVFCTLRNNDFEWKAVTPYQLRCKPVQPDAEEGTSGPHLKIGIQLYKVNSEQYLLDFKKLEGDTFCFFNRCAALLTLVAAEVELREEKQ